jgi:SAM-dependent methyltransferase
MKEKLFALGSKLGKTGKQRKLETEIARLKAERDKARAQRDKQKARNAKLQEKLEAERKRAAKLRTERTRLWFIVHKNDYNLAVPPDHLQTRVVGGHSTHFLIGGREVADDIKRIMADGNVDITAAKKALDFGCGCGRVVRFMKADHRATDYFGTDIDAEAIGWCQQNLSDVGKFDVNGDVPPTIYGNGQFDFIYSISIFTHLPEDLQHQWLAELRRITNPGGHLLLTIHGEKHFQHIPPSLRAEMSQRGFCYVKTGTTDGLPEYYQTTYHAPDYVASVWSKYFRILKHIPRGIGDNQDAIICQRT